MRNLRNFFFLLLVIIFFGNLFFRVSSYQKEYTTHFNAEYWRDRYYASQWVVSNSKNPIGDDGLYAYVGWEYIHGANPTLLNAEIPPLGKYIIGAGEVVFGNQNILILIIGVLCLLVFYLVNVRLFKDKLIAFIPVVIFSFDPIFYTQLRAPYLDTIYLLFLLLTILFTLHKKYFFAAFFLGCFASVKFPAASIFLVAPMMLWVAIWDRKNMKRFLASLILWPTTFILFYFQFFLLGGTPYAFLGVQKWIISFYSMGAKASYGIVYPMILFNSWSTWFSGVQKVSEWTLIWPVSFIGSVFSAIPLLRIVYAHVFLHKKKEVVPEDYTMTLILFWVLSYMVFLTVTPVFPRYLLLLLPFMYNLTVWFLVKYVFRQSS
ncbi:MAG TPA: hypothetical protein PKA38_02390 [Candidatus Levybacteria bacterium]|mgnify:CR=1 FL=1|nr:hypothetical protein [Candidatus Levybacteria bacterium]